MVPGVRVTVYVACADRWPVPVGKSRATSVFPPADENGSVMEQALKEPAAVVEHGAPGVMGLPSYSNANPLLKRNPVPETVMAVLPGPEDELNVMLGGVTVSVDVPLEDAKTGSAVPSKATSTEYEPGAVVDGIGYDAVTLPAFPPVPAVGTATGDPIVVAPSLTVNVRVLPL
jgi:hypothetical protein